MDGGATFHRGQAIDVTDAPNQTVINLLGGNIYGNIDVQAGDEINVTTDETVFNGVINSSCMPAGGPTALTYDNAALSGCGVGALTIAGDGNLHMVIDPVDGPAYAFVDSLTVEADGTLTVDLPAATGSAPIGTYPQIYADTVTLNGGTLVANIASSNGLYETTTYNNVIDGNTRTGEFDQCLAPGIVDNSLLLSFDCAYEDGNVDLVLTRSAFDSVAGLNGNGSAVGSGLECIYDVGLTGGPAAMFADLFMITDAGNYNVALNQLSGSSYANYLNSFPSLGVHYNDLVDHATNCEIPALAGSVLECRASSPIHVWGQLDYQWRKADGDSEAGTTKAKRFSGLMGIDANVGDAAILGISAGYVTNNLRDRQFGDSVKGDGWQLGAYAVYDPGPFFVKAMTTYSSLNGDSTRHINFTGLGAGTSFAGTLDGDPDVKMWTAGLHGGARLPMGGASVVTPYLNLDYVHAKMDGFTETGLSGAALRLFDAKSNHTFLTVGAKWATQMGGVVPEVNLGYRHRFENSRSHFTGQFFDGSSLTNCDFDIVSASQNRGTFLAGLSVGGKMGPVDLRIGYEGEFNGDVTSHSGNFKIVLPLGGHAAPPPPAPVVAPPPPPPPAPVVEQAPPPPPPPPPPAPVERGERGQ
jgi:outer membrane autotransporter protein